MKTDSHIKYSTKNNKCVDQKDELIKFAKKLIEIADLANDEAKKLGLVGSSQLTKYATPCILHINAAALQLQAVACDFLSQNDSSFSKEEMVSKYGYCNTQDNF